MNIARRRQFWTAAHRYGGLASMIFLLIAAVTGCVLCVDHRIDAALNPDLFRTYAAGPVLAPLDLIERIERANPMILITQFPLAGDAGHTIEAHVAPRDQHRSLGFDQIFLDPHDGRIVGTRQSGAGPDRRHIVDAIYSFHYTLLAGRWGRWLMGIAALCWLIGNLVGFYITLPVRKPFWQKWRRFWLIDFRVRLRWVMVDIHRASGLWLLIGLTGLAATSVALNFFEEAFVPVISALSPPHASPFDRPAPPAAADDKRDDIGFAAALATAARTARMHGLEWQPAVAIHIPDRHLYGLMFTASGRESYRGLGPVTYYVDSRTGAFVFADDPYHGSAGRMAERVLYPLHSGEIIGPAGIAIIFLVGLATIEMCVSGFYIWWKKRRMKPPRRASRAPR